MNKKLLTPSPSLFASVLWLAASLPAAGWAQTPTAADGTAVQPAMDHGQMNMGDMKGMDHSAMDKGAMQGMDHSKMNMGDMKGMDHGAKDKGAMQGMDHSKMNMGDMKGMDRGAMDKGAMRGMDHSKMNMDGMKGMDHSTMNMGDMKGMDHGAMDKGAMQGMDHGKMNMGDMKGMDHSTMNMGDMKGMDHGAMDKGAMKGMDHGKMNMGDMKGMDMGAMQGGSAPADARDPDAYSDGLTLGPMPGMAMNDNATHAQLLVDRLEATHTRDANGQVLDAKAWFGTDLNKLWINLEAERSGGRLESARSEVLWDHAISTYWNLQTGLRHDSGGGPGRTWAAFGVRGLAPYWFELQATAYVGESGRTAARLEAEYEVLLTQRLILQPRIEVNAYGKSDAARGLGSGLSDMEAGVRMRYEITRKFAPYVGVSWGHKFGGTADYAQRSGEDASQTKWVAGVKFWF